jgi:hypothetical protein
MKNMIDYYFDKWLEFMKEPFEKLDKGSFKKLEDLIVNEIKNRTENV